MFGGTRADGSTNDEGMSGGHLDFSESGTSLETKYVDAPHIYINSIQTRYVNDIPHVYGPVYMRACEFGNVYKYVLYLKYISYGGGVPALMVT